MMLPLFILTVVPTVPVATGTGFDFTWTFIKMLAALGAVTILALLVLKFLAPKLGFAKRFHRGKYFHVLGRSTLEPKKSLYLVKFGARHLVLGVADDGVRLITEASAEEVEREEEA